MMGEHGLAWPWESLHIEALAWFDHGREGQDTGILDVPRFRYIIPEVNGCAEGAFLASGLIKAPLRATLWHMITN